MALTMKERLDQMIQRLEPEVGELVKFVIEKEKDTLGEKYARVKEDVRKHIDQVVSDQMKDKN